MKMGFTFAFGELLEDIGPWLLLGIAVAGAITSLLPEGLIEKYLGSGFLSLLIMLAAGIPVFVCATSSTPIVAALALKGLSPGAALVFLLAGPVTNAATITVLIRLLGKKVTAIYVAVIAAISLLMGMCVNGIYAFLSIRVSDWVQGSSSEDISIFSVFMALLLLCLILRIFIRNFLRKSSARTAAHICGSPKICASVK